jgi:hypothetical protein
MRTGMTGPAAEYARGADDSSANAMTEQISAGTSTKISMDLAVTKSARQASGIPTDSTVDTEPLEGRRSHLAQQRSG